MTDKQSDQAGSYELDLDDTISNWSSVVEDAMSSTDAAETATPGGRTSVRDAGKARPADEDEDDVIVLGEDESAEDLREILEEADDETAKSAKSAEIPFEVADRIARLEAESEGLRERLTRTLADFENTRKRFEREKETLQRFANFECLRDFLAVFDNLERALAASGGVDDVKQGVEMIARQFMDMLKRYGVEPVPAVGEPFDPRVHEAVSSEQKTDVDVPTVTSEMQRGYVLHDRLLRPAMVSVAMPAPKPPPMDPSADETIFGTAPPLEGDEAPASAAAEDAESEDAPAAPVEDVDPNDETASVLPEEAAATSSN